MKQYLETEQEMKDYINEINEYAKSLEQENEKLKTMYDKAFKELCRVNLVLHSLADKDRKIQ